MFCTKPKKRKIPPDDPLCPITRAGLLSPLKSLKLSPIARSQESRSRLGSCDWLAQGKGKTFRKNDYIYCLCYCIDIISAESTVGNRKFIRISGPAL